MNVGVPIFPAGKEPLPPGLTEDDRPALEQQKKMEKFMRMASESCPFKTVLSGGVGFGLGAVFSLMSTSFAYEDPMNRLTNDPNLSTRQKTSEFFRSTGKSMWRSGSGFAKVGALYSGVECCIEGVSLIYSILVFCGASVPGALVSLEAGFVRRLPGGLPSEVVFTDNLPTGVES
ncbi:Mitochondrial import inner membrane translocase subunit tim22 [Ceratobasidium sp. 394]|nr:Mitochondrial import inner membrane translocase subunit tim22 [Ceratobasidium sp. 394]